MSTYFTGDTIRVKVTFRDWAPSPTVGPVIDPDAVSVRVYDSGLVELFEVPDGDSKIVNVSTGVYYYDWVLPTTDGTYFIEFRGDYNDPTGLEPCIVRKQIKTKFKPVA